MEPKKIILEHHDYIINDKLNLSDDEVVYFLPSWKNAFLKTGEKIISINLEAISFIEGDFKKKLTEFLKNKTVIIPDYKTASRYLEKEVLNVAISIENLMFIKNEQIDFYNLVTSAIKREKYFDLIYFMLNKFNDLKDLSKDELVYFNNLMIKDIATNILCNSLVYSNDSMSDLFYKYKNLYVKKIEYSNKRAITGRIICTDKFNIHTIDHTDERRKSIISRFSDGFLINFDYDSFETRFAMHISENKEFIAKYFDKDLHEEMGKIIYSKEIISKEERKMGKNINHTIIFGGGKNRIISMLENIENKESVYQNIMSFIYPILVHEKKLDEEYKELGYIKNYFGTFVYPNKDYALFNNYIQSTAADIIARKIIAVNSILNPYRSKIITAIHDSIIVDFHPEESFLIEIIANEMKYVGNFEFNLKVEKMFNLF